MTDMPDPALSAAFRQAMRSVASAVYLITARGPDGDVGMTATAACSLSFEPMSVLISVNRGSSLFQTLAQTGRFAVNILSDADADIALAFGNPAHRDSRFAAGDWQTLDGLPVLATAIASLSCDIAESMDFGTHRVIAGLVRHVDNRAGRAELLYCDGKFRTLHPAG